MDTQGDAFLSPSRPRRGRLQAPPRDGGLPRPDPGADGLHTGTPYVDEEGYVGVDVHRAARIAACGHGGQVLVSASTAALSGTEGLPTWASTGSRTSPPPSASTSSETASFPALKSLYRTNLPVPATPFLGREHELARCSRCSKARAC